MEMCGFWSRFVFEQPAGRRDVAPLWLILAAVAIGLAAGALFPPVEQRGVDGALVLAGIVPYPADSITAHYYLGSWTLIHQLGAMLLVAGVGQTAVSWFFSLAAYALPITTYAMIIYGFSRRPWFALAAATLCFISNPISDFLASPDYPLVGSKWEGVPGTYGLWANVGAAWVIGVLAGGRNVLAGFSAAVLVAIHPVLGAYIMGLLCLALVLGRLFGGLDTRGIVRGLLLGAPLTVVSFAVFLWTRPSIPHEVDMAAFQSYLQFWDYHRNRPMSLVDAVSIGGLSILEVIALGMFLKLSGRERPSAAVAAIVVLAAVAVSVPLYFALHLVPAILPQIVILVIPGRLLNIQGFVATAVAIGLAVWALDCALSAPVGTAGRRLGLLARRLEASLASALGRGRQGELAADAPRVRAVLCVVILGLLVAYPSHLRSRLWRVWPHGEELTFWQKVRTAGIKGMVLTTAASSQAALRYGHLAVAVDLTGFDFPPYFPSTSKELAHIIEKGYGVSFHNPPPEVRYRSGLFTDIEKSYWEKLTPDVWQSLSRELGIVAVVAPSDWTMSLPAAVAGKKYTLYRTVGTSEPARN